MNTIGSVTCAKCSTVCRRVDAFCSTCGAPLKDPAASAPAPAPAVGGDKLRLKQVDKACPSCGGRIPVESVVCTHCGMDFRTGERIAAAAPRANPFRASAPALAHAGAVAARVALTLLVVVGVLAIVSFIVHQTLLENYPAYVHPDGSRGAAAPAGAPGATNAEPDWATVYSGHYAACLLQFAPPATNVPVELVLVDGKSMHGLLVAAESNLLMVATGDMTVGIPRARLGAESRQAYFAEEWAAVRAREATAADRLRWTQRSATGDVASVARPGAAADGPGTRELTCRFCGGEGYVMVRKGNPERDVRVSCPLCMSRGVVTRPRIPPDGQPCPDCQEMGQRIKWVEQDEARFPVRVVCPRCIGKGYVNRRTAGGPSAPNAGRPALAPPEPPPPPAPPPPEPHPVLKAIDWVWHVLGRVFGHGGGQGTAAPQAPAVGGQGNT